MGYHLCDQHAKSLCVKSLTTKQKNVDKWQYLYYNELVQGKRQSVNTQLNKSIAQSQNEILLDRKYLTCWKKG